MDPRFFRKYIDIINEAGDPDYVAYQQLKGQLDSMNFLKGDAGKQSYTDVDPATQSAQTKMQSKLDGMKQQLISKGINPDDDEPAAQPKTEKDVQDLNAKYNTKKSQPATATQSTVQKPPAVGIGGTTQPATAAPAAQPAQPTQPTQPAQPAQPLQPPSKPMIPSTTPPPAPPAAQLPKPSTGSATTASTTPTIAAPAEPNPSTGSATTTETVDDVERIRNFMKKKY